MKKISLLFVSVMLFLGTFQKTKAQTTETFVYTGAMETFTVPACVSHLTITCYGGSGANGTSSSGVSIGGIGGLGGTTSGIYPVNYGQVLNLFVGGTAIGSTAGYNGGGSGIQLSGAGGGTSDVRIGGTTLTDRIMVAGGGGGGGNAGTIVYGTIAIITGGNGGVGGGGNGIDGLSSSAGGGGFGAIGMAAGIGGSGCSTFPSQNGEVGALGIGGNATNGPTCCSSVYPAGGAGGGGYNGGGAGGTGGVGTIGCSYNDTGAGGGGAGGTNFIDALFTNTTTTNGTATIGNGSIVISYTIDSPIGDTTAIACDSFLWFGTYYTTSGSPTHVLTTTTGCDSTVTLDLTIVTLDLSLSMHNDTIYSNEMSATYQWLDCDNSNLPIDGETNRWFVPLANGNYSVIIDNGICSDTSVCQNITGVGINHNISKSFQIDIFPNPNTGIINLNIFGAKTANIKIINAVGGIVYQTISNDTKSIIDLSKQPNGIYIVEVTTEAGTKKQLIIKQ